MAENIRLLVYPAKDLKAGKAVFNTFLGVEPYVDGDYYVGYKVNELEIGLDPNGGASTYQDVKDVGGGMVIAQVKDTNGNVLGLRQQCR
jgi:hypothetical protein